MKQFVVFLDVCLDLRWPTKEWMTVTLPKLKQVNKIR